MEFSRRLFAAGDIAGEQVKNERQGKAELLANAIGLRWSDEDELGDRGNVTGDEQSTGKLRLTTMYSYL